MAMSEVAQQGDGGDFHFEIKFVDEGWQWVVSQKDRGRIGSGHGITREDAKAAAITIAGRAPDKWIDLTPDALNS